MKAGKLRTKKEHLYENTEKGNILKFCAIYGANSAGKSNLSKAMNFLRAFVLIGKPSQNSSELYCMTRKENKEKSTFFEICILVDGVPYTYGLEINLQAQIVQKEWLYYEKTEKPRYLFKKESCEAGIEFFDILKDIKELSVLGKVFSSGESPFLFSINHNTRRFFEENPSAIILNKIFNWFSQNFEVIYPDQAINDTALLGENGGLAEYSRLLSEFKTGIVRIDEEDTSEEKVKNSISLLDRANLELQMNIVNTFNKASGNKQKWAAIVRNRANIFTIRMDENGNAEYKVLKFVHKYKDEEVKFEMRRESDGTYRLFQLLDILLTSKNKVYMIDEISRCMHPLLTIKFIEKFLEECKNRNVQLIVTTHETHLMKHEYLRRDEIWNCEQNENGETLLKSFDRPEVRIDKVIEENYLEGNFGGLPY